MNERGFALPITIFLIAILTLMLGSAFTRAATENQIAGGSKATVDALFVAEAGLQKYFSQDFTDLESPRPLSGDSVRLDVPGGWAWVVPDVLKTPADTMDNFRYIIRSTGYVEDPNDRSIPLASRTVAQFADWQTPWLDAIGVGRTDWVRSPLPPNRTCGSPASGSPVGGVTSKRIDGPSDGLRLGKTAHARQRRCSATVCYPRSRNLDRYDQHDDAGSNASACGSSRPDS